MKIDCQRLLSVSLQNNVLSEGRGPGRMPLWTRKVKCVYNIVIYIINIIFITFTYRLVVEKFVEVYVEFDQLNLVFLF